MRTVNTGYLVWVRGGTIGALKCLSEFQINTILLPCVQGIRTDNGWMEGAAWGNTSPFSTKCYARVCASLVLDMPQHLLHFGTFAVIDSHFSIIICYFAHSVLPLCRFWARFAVQDQCSDIVNQAGNQDT